MNDRVFLDTNIIIYLYSEDEGDKRDVAYQFVNNNKCVTSIQVMNEISNVWRPPVSKQFDAYVFCRRA